MDAAVAAHTTLLAPAFATDDLFVTSDFTAGVGPEFDALMRASLARTDLRVTVMIGPEILFDIGDGYPEAPFAQRVLGALRRDAEDRGATPPDAFVHLTPIGAGLSLLAVAYGPTLG
ncbi:hypothetical protein [Brevibacterium samyangense]|uniref:Uncharacterized protein n=1 Tax=Brevibacterium samyangense TaxID=366888 RepID=A0ABN2TIQ0_9MICO